MTQKIILVAMTKDRVIGRQGRLPWSLSDDLKLFRRLTTGNTLIMGRLTFQSLEGPLQERYNIVISRTLASGEGFRVCGSFAEALSFAETLGQKIFFVGGTEIYREALPIADALAVSWVAGDYAGDTFFPAIDFSNWEKISETAYNGFRHSQYRRRKESTDSDE